MMDFDVEVETTTADTQSNVGVANRENGTQSVSKHTNKLSLKAFMNKLDKLKKLRIPNITSTFKKDY